MFVASFARVFSDAVRTATPKNSTVRGVGGRAIVEAADVCSGALRHDRFPVDAVGGEVIEEGWLRGEGFESETFGLCAFGGFRCALMEKGSL